MAAARAEAYVARATEAATEAAAETIARRQSVEAAAATQVLENDLRVREAELQVAKDEAQAARAALEAARQETLAVKKKAVEKFKEKDAQHARVLTEREEQARALLQQVAELQQQLKREVKPAAAAPDAVEVVD